MTGKKSSARDGDDVWVIAALGTLGLIALLLVLPAIALAVGVWVWAKDRFTHKEYILLLVAGLGAWAIAHSFLWNSYVPWMFALVARNASWSSFPWLTIVTNAAILVGLFGLLSGTRVTKNLPSRFRARTVGGERETILPTAQEKAQLSAVVSTPGMVHAPIISDGPVGSRQFQLAIGASAEPVLLSEAELRTHVMLLGSTGSGKALDVDTPIATPTGWTTMGQLTVGDTVFDDAGAPCHVTFVTPIQHQRSCFSVVFNDGSEIVADADHRWVTETAPQALNSDPRQRVAIRTTADILNTLYTDAGTPNHRINAVRAIRPGSATEPVEVTDLVNDTWGVGQALPARMLRADVALRQQLLSAIVVRFADIEVATSSGWTVRTTLACGDQLVELATSCGVIVAANVDSDDTMTVTSLTSTSSAWGQQFGEYRYIVDVVPVASRPVRCIRVDSKTHMYAAGKTFIPTHNTETIKVLAGTLLQLGWSGMILDLKEDAGPGGLREWCEQYSQLHQVPYQQLCSSSTVSPTWFNPLDGLGPDEIRDTILALQDFDDAHWANINKEMLGQLVNLSVWAHQVDPASFPAPNMYDLGLIMAKDNLPAATKRMRAALVKHPGVDADMFDVLAHPSDATKKSAPGYGAKLKQIFETQAGRTVLRPAQDGSRRVIDVTAKGLTYLGLDSLGKADLTLMVSSAVLQRMSAYAAARTTGTAGAAGPPNPRFLIVDEAGWVNRTIVQNLLARARSAGISVILCTQGPLDWIDKKGDDWGMMTNNVNVALIMAQGSPESAELCADYLGHSFQQRTRETVSKAKGLLWDKPIRNASGEVVESHSVSDELAHIVEPEELRQMTVGDIIVRVGKPETRVQWGKVQRRSASDGDDMWEEATLQT